GSPERRACGPPRGRLDADGPRQRARQGVAAHPCPRAGGGQGSAPGHPPTQTLSARAPKAERHRRPNAERHRRQRLSARRRRLLVRSLPARDLCRGSLRPLCVRHRAAARVLRGATRRSPRGVSVDPRYQSPINRDVPPAAEGEFAALQLGPLRVWPPVVLAPMAGVTNYPFRALCRRFGAGLYVSEMITARPLVEGNQKTLRLADFGPDETPRSLQLYGVNPHYVNGAVRRLVGEGRVDHIDMHFGCPVPKVTRRGGGSAIPVKPRLLAAIVRAAVQAAGSNGQQVPVTIKFRLGIDDELITFRDAGRVGEEEGCAAVGLHARTAAQLYDGVARWEHIGEMKSVVRIPVLGNGDIWEAQDALLMMRTTGCDGVIVGRGCLGRPWLFRDLADVFQGRTP